MKIAICDDELHIREIVKQRLLTRREIYCNMEIQQYHSGNDLVNDMQRFCPDILFLDIKMVGMDGLETAEKALEQNDNLIIVLLTGYADYAQKGYLVNASGFILKENINDEFEEVFSHAVEKWKKITSDSIIIQYEYETFKLRVKSIVFAESKKRKLFIHTTDGIYSCYKKLDDFEREVIVFNFIRPHKSFLVNFLHISKVLRNEIIMDDDTHIPISEKHQKKVSEDFVRLMVKEKV